MAVSLGSAIGRLVRSGCRLGTKMLASLWSVFSDRRRPVRSGSDINAKAADRGKLILALRPGKDATGQTWEDAEGTKVEAQLRTAEVDDCV